MGLSAGVIDAAWARRRRRVAIVTVCAAVVACGAALGIALRSPHLAAVGVDGAPRSLPAASVFSQAPYMGVACRVANSTWCDRVGLAVWLRTPARAVSATIAGQPVALSATRAQPFLPPLARALTMFVGYLQPAGIVSRLHAVPEGSRGWWAPSPSNAPAPRVRVRIEYAGGAVAVTTLDVALQAGWG